jgi:putative ABC transport system permease protein
MILNYLLLTARTFLKNITAFTINLVGMAIALGCCITAYVNYEYSTGFDKQQENAASIHRIGFWQQTEKGKIPYGVAPLPLGNLLRQNLQPGDHVIQYIAKAAQFRIGDEMFAKDFVYVDPSFPTLFTMEILHGSLGLRDKSNVLISDLLARTYYGRTDVVGQPLTQIIAGQAKEFTVSGVYEAFQPNSSFRFDLLTTFDNYFIDPAQKSRIENEWSRWSTTFLFLKDASAVEPLTKKLQEYVKTQNDARPDLRAESFYIEPFIGMANRALKQRNQGHWLNMPMPPAAVIAPFAMAGFLLLVACFNFMNNAIAVAGNRLKEIGIRKVVGGRRKELIFQFLSETFFFCLLALGLGLLLAEYFVDGWNGMWTGIELRITYVENISLLIALAMLIVATALLAGGYPAFYISAFRPIEILRGTTRFSGPNMLTKSLLVVQFSISLAAVIFALAFYFNSKFQKEYDLGYAWRSVIQVPLENPSQYEKLKIELSVNPLIHSIAGSQHHIYANSYKASARNEKQKEKEIDMLNVGDDYFETVGVKLISGQQFEKDLASDVKESIIVNEEFLRVFGLGSEGVGKRITINDTTQVYIKGVVKDVYLRALFQPLSPIAFRYAGRENYKYLVASTDPARLAAVNGQMKESWKKLFPSSVYTGRLMEYNMVMALEHFDAVVILYTFLGIVAIIMSVSGLFSLVSLNLQRRKKEMGIRKILGAPLSNIAYQSSKLFLVVMVFSFILGSLMGMTMVNGLMNSVWEYYEAVDIKVITMAIAILFSIAVLTIFSKIFNLTVANPAEALKQE